MSRRDNPRRECMHACLSGGPAQRKPTRTRSPVGPLTRRSSHSHWRSPTRMAGQRAWTPSRNREPGAPTQNGPAREKQQRQHRAVRRTVSRPLPVLSSPPGPTMPRPGRAPSGHQVLARRGPAVSPGLRRETLNFGEAREERRSGWRWGAWGPRGRDRTPSRASPDVHWVSRRLLDVPVAEKGVVQGRSLSVVGVGSTGQPSRGGLIFATVGPAVPCSASRDESCEGGGSL